MGEYLILRFDAPLQAWGDIAMDPRRPTRAFPSRSGLAGLLGSALGWRYRDGERTTILQDSLRYAVREDRQPEIVRDYQTAHLGNIGKRGWTRWGIESRGGASADGTQILEKYYLADGAFSVALGLTEAGNEPSAQVSLDDLEIALRRPARPLFLGRRGCLPATPLLPRVGNPTRLFAETPLDVLALKQPLEITDLGDLEEANSIYVRAWYDPMDGSPRCQRSSPRSEYFIETEEIWDRRDFRNNRFAGARRVARTLIPISNIPTSPAEAAA